MSCCCIKNGKWIVPGEGITTEDRWVQDGVFTTHAGKRPDHIVDAAGCWVLPCAIDVHVHFREPGKEAAETIETGAAAALAGGFSHVVMMPNTTPSVDRVVQVEQMKKRIERVEKKPHILISACLTEDRKGESPAEISDVARCGVVAFTDDGSTPADELVMRTAAQSVAVTGLPLMDHAEMPHLHTGVMHEGAASQRCGLPGISRQAEIQAVRRDIEIAKETGVRLHIQHVSTKEAVEMIAKAREAGFDVTGEATPHHLAFCDEDVDPENANYKMNPPLREASDRAALRQAVREGSITILATDHAPHTQQEKDQGFEKAPFGIIGLETALAVTYEVLVCEMGMNPEQWIERWTAGPAHLLGMSAPSCQPGAPANFILFDPDHAWVFTKEHCRGKSINSPWLGRHLKGRVVSTYLSGGKIWAALDSTTGSH